MSLRATSGKCEAKAAVRSLLQITAVFLASTGIWLVQILAPQQKYDYQRPLLDHPTV